MAVALQRARITAKRPPERIACFAMWHASRFVRSYDEAERRKKAACPLPQEKLGMSTSRDALESYLP